MLNSVVKISMMSAKYFEYYTIMVGGGLFLWTHCSTGVPVRVLLYRTLSVRRYGAL